MLVVCATLAALPLQARAADSGIDVIFAETELSEGVYLLNAEIDYRLSESADRALRSGVPLVFEVEIELLRKRRLLWKETVAELTQRYSLRYHAFTERYQLTNLNSGVQESISSLSTALGRLGLIGGIPLIDQKLLEEGKHSVRLRASLDLNELPIPLYTLALVTPSWYLGGDWFEIPLQ